MAIHGLRIFNNDADRKFSGLKIHTPASFLLQNPDNFGDLMRK